MLKNLMFRLRHRFAIWKWERKHGKFGPTPF